MRRKLEGDWTRTYRPTEDWPAPIEEILAALPPEAFDPPFTEKVRYNIRGRRNAGSEGESKESDKTQV